MQFNNELDKQNYLKQVIIKKEDSLTFSFLDQENTDNKTLFLSGDSSYFQKINYEFQFDQFRLDCFFLQGLTLGLVFGLLGIVCFLLNHRKSFRIGFLFGFFYNILICILFFDYIIEKIFNQFFTKIQKLY